MKKVLVGLAAVFTIVLGVSTMQSNAQAEDSCTEQQVTDFQSCVEEGIDMCNNDSCDVGKAGASVDGAIDEVLDFCCDKRNLKKCFRGRQRKVSRSQRITPRGQVKDFLKTLKSEIREIRRSPSDYCPDEDYSQLF